LATRLAAELNGRNDRVRSLTFGAYLTSTWLPGKKITLADSTWDGYRRKIERHIIPQSAVSSSYGFAPTGDAV
jgi:hypothetical protein